MTIEILNEIKILVLDTVAAALSTDKEYVTITIKKFNVIYDQGYSVTGTYRRQELFEEESGTFQVELKEDLEMESFEIY